MNGALHHVTRAELNAALKNTTWDLGNQVLYDLCRDHPRHNSADVVIAKVWLIGRSYSAAIERRRSPTAYGDSFYTKHVAPAVLVSNIDDSRSFAGFPREEGRVAYVESPNELSARAESQLRRKVSRTKFLAIHHRLFMHSCSCGAETPWRKFVDWEIKANT